MSRRASKPVSDDSTTWPTRKKPPGLGSRRALIDTRKPTEYDAAVTLLTDLQALAEREDRYDTFTLRTIALRHAHSRKTSLIERFNRAGI